MDLYSVRILRSQPLRLGLTTAGIALCIVLMFFLLSIYRGVEDGSVEYIRKNNADLWVLQRNAWNILRGSSLLSTGHGKLMESIDGIESVSPALLLLSGIKKDNMDATVFLVGYDPQSMSGGPPGIIQGSSIKNNNDIILDHSFARKYDFNIGDKVFIQDDTLIVAGLSCGTNAMVIQYAFVTLKKARDLIGFPSLVTCFMVQVQKGQEIEEISTAIKEELIGVEVYSHEDFLMNNIREMEMGFLPFLSVIAVLGIIVLTVILSLLLSISILESRKDYAILKILGSPNRFLPKIVLEQSILISSAGIITALILDFPIVFLIESVIPEVNTKSTIIQIIFVILIVWIISVFSSFLSSQKLRRIYPLEVFS